MHEPFMQHAIAYLKAGMSLVPCKGKDGKCAKVKWGKYQCFQPYEDIVLNWAEKHPDANIGLITGRISNITVIDNDDPNRSLKSLEEQFGETPLVAKTPSGGLHLYYRYNGEKSGQYAEEKIDVRGAGGLIIAPPSINSELGKSYQFIKGNLDNLSDLPAAKNVNMQPAKTDKANTIPIGERNHYVFLMLKEKALDIDSYDRLCEVAFEINQDSLEAPLPDRNVKNTVNSVWGYKQNGSLWPKKVKQFAINQYDFADLSDVPYALTLYQSLISHHYGVRKSFCVAQQEVAHKLRWTDRRKVKSAIEVLLERGKLQYARKANGRKPHIYTFGPFAWIGGR